MPTSNSSGSAGRPKPRGLFFRIRVTLLLCLLAGVLVYSVNDVQRRTSRNEWRRALRVAIVLLTRGEVDADAVARVQQRVPALEAHLNREFRRHAAGSRAFRLSFFGPVDVSREPPRPPEPGWFDVVSYHIRQWRYIRAVDSALALESDEFDCRIYVVARPSFNPRAQLVEGHSQQGGRIGVVQVELNRAMTDMLLAVAAHELFHTLGATDKYDAFGNSQIPDGLAEPQLHPRFPQRYVEIMSRNRPLSPGKELPLDRIEELRVGPLTAREVGWIRE